MRKPKEVLLQWEAIPQKQRNGKVARSMAKLCGMRSMLEVFIAAGLDEYGLDWDYEPEKWEYTFGIQKYTPDFRVVTPNGKVIYIEGKGKMTSGTRKILRYATKCNPDKDLRVIFERAKNYLKRGSKTTYGKWCDDHQIEWTDKIVKKEWFE